MSSRVDTVLVEKTVTGLRLDVFLRQHYPPISRATFQRLMEEGQIRVNGNPTKPNHTPRAGEIIEISWPEAKPAEAQPEEMPLAILFEDQDLLVLNKPPGLVVHPAAGHEEHTLVNALLHHCAGQLSGIGGVARPGIVHRLDKDTSGCLVVAKNDVTHLALSTQFAGRQVQKVYHALLCGKLLPKTGEIKTAIARHPTHRKRMAVIKGGRDAWTSYKVLQHGAIKGQEITLVEALLHTGRTHQIRVHFQSIGFPLVGDEVYGKRPNQKLREATGSTFPRQMLHAYSLSFQHPTTKKTLTLVAPWPEDFKQTCLQLGGWQAPAN